MSEFIKLVNIFKASLYEIISYNKEKQATYFVVNKYKDSIPIDELAKIIIQEGYKIIAFKDIRNKDTSLHELFFKVKPKKTSVLPWFRIFS